MEPQEKANIIYILADDLDISELGCYGQRLMKLLISTGYHKKE